jgi:hypothetical protein
MIRLAIDYLMNMILGRQVTFANDSKQYLQNYLTTFAATCKPMFLHLYEFHSDEHSLYSSHGYHHLASMCQVTWHVCLERDCNGGSKRYFRIAKECSNPERDQNGFPNCKEVEVNDAKHPDFFRTCDICSESNQRLHEDLKQAKAAGDSEAVTQLIGMQPLLGMQVGKSALPEQSSSVNEATTGMLPGVSQAERWSLEHERLRASGTTFVDSTGRFVVPEEWRTETYLGKEPIVSQASKLRYSFARNTAPKDPQPLPFEEQKR